MKVLFITRPYLIDPLGLALLSASLKKAGHETFLELHEDGKDFALLNKVIKIQPDILAYSVYTGAHDYYVKLNKMIREQTKLKAVSVFGGPHCTYFEDIKDNEYVDVVMQGECDLTFPQLLEDLDTYKFPVVIKADMNPQDLDALPLPDRSLIYKFERNRNNPIKNIMTSRGCPFACPYCYNSVYNKMFCGKTVRYRNIDSVIEEGRKIKEDYPATEYIFFEDDEFIAIKDRVLEFSKKWKEIVDLPFHVQIRIDMLTEEKLKALVDAGCTSVTFAIETGNEDRRKNVLNRNISDKKILDGAALLRKYNIPFRTENMLATPQESLANALETLDINIKCKPMIGWASLFQPYPKTPMGEWAKELGLFSGKLEDIPATFFEETIIKMDKKLKRQFENLQRLFGLVCSFPILRMFVPLLIRLPQNKLYDYIYTSWKNNQYNKLYKVG